MNQNPPATVTAIATTSRSGKPKTNTGDGIYLARNAITQCISTDRLELSKNYPFIILLIVFYFTVSHSHNLITDPSTTCKKNIKIDNYDDFISSFVYWIISFILIIIIKYNKMNLVNNFVINGDLYSSSIGSGTTKEMIQRGVSIFDILISGIISILNIYFVILMLVTLYKIIQNFITLITCDSKQCSKQQCGKDSSTAKYVINGGCYDKKFNPINDKFKSSQLTDDLYPQSIRDIINFWTLNYQTWRGKSIWVLFMISIVISSGFYIVYGLNGMNKVKSAVFLSPFIIFVIINIVYLVKGEFYDKLNT